MRCRLPGRIRYRVVYMTTLTFLTLSRNRCSGGGCGKKAAAQIRAIARLRNQRQGIFDDITRGGRAPGVALDPGLQILRSYGPSGGVVQTIIGPLDAVNSFRRKTAKIRIFTLWPGPRPNSAFLRRGPRRRARSEKFLRGKSHGNVSADDARPRARCLRSHPTALPPSNN
jgi:hypothetical protein